MNFPHETVTLDSVQANWELSLISLPQVTSNLLNLGLHLGNSLSVYHGGILHIIDGLACKLHEGLESVMQSGL